MQLVCRYTTNTVLSQSTKPHNPQIKDPQIEKVYGYIAKRVLVVPNKQDKRIEKGSYRCFLSRLESLSSRHD